MKGPKITCENQPIGREDLPGSRFIDDEFHVSLLSCYMARKDFYPSR